MLVKKQCLYSYSTLFTKASKLGQEVELGQVTAIDRVTAQAGLNGRRQEWLGGGYQGLGEWTVRDFSEQPIVRSPIGRRPLRSLAPLSSAGSTSTC